MELGLGLGLGSALDSLSHSSSHALPSSRHPPFTHSPFPPCSLVCGGQPSPHKSQLVVSHITCPPLSSSHHAHNFVLGTAVINNNQPPWSFGFYSQTRGTRENRATPCVKDLKYRVPHGSQLVHTVLSSSSLAGHVLHYPPPPTQTT